MRFSPVSIASIFIASTTMTAACGGGGGAKTAQELADKAMAALIAKDFNALKAGFATGDMIKPNCPDLPAEKAGKLAEELAEELADAEKDFKSCLETDWTGAKVTGVTGGESDDAVEGCGGKVMEVKDIKLAVEVGGKKMEVKVNDPIKVGDGYYFLEGLRCKAPEVTCDDVFDNMSKIIAAAPDAREGEKEMFTGKADKKAEFNTVCSQMQNEPRFKPVLECFATAKDYAGVKGCEDKAKADAMKAAGEDPGAAPTEPPPPAVAPAPAPAAPDAPAAPAAPAAAGSGDDLCAKYIAKMTACAEAMPEAARDPMKKALDQVKTSLDGQPDENKKLTCGAAINAAKQSMGQMCPAVTWE